LRPGNPFGTAGLRHSDDAGQARPAGRRGRDAQALALESAIEKLDKYHLIILDDLCYVRRDQAETSVLFELIAARYERRSLLVTSNQPFGEWTSVFPDAAMTLAAVDRLVHHAVILEMNVESYRRRAAASRHNPRNSSDTKRDTKAKEVTTEPVA
jgi:hypothetical protein